MHEHQPEAARLEHQPPGRDHGRVVPRVSEMFADTSGNGTKRRRANELSEKMLLRVLTISSREGDLVLDPFGGSGTTYAVAEQTHRRWLGIEMGDVKPIIDRLEGQPAQVAFPNRGSAGNGIGWKSARALRPA